MTYFTTSLSCTANSSTPGASTVCALDWRGGSPTTVVVTATNSGSSIFYNIQYTLDDVNLVGGTSLAYWQNLSSAWADTSVNTSSGSLFASSNLDPAAGLTVSLLSPIAAVRLNSTALTAGPLVMKVIQGEGW